MRRVLVTGGSGFLGSHVAAGLARHGWEVSVLDVVPPKGDFQFHRGDLGSLPSVVAAMAEVDAVCHLAAVGDVYLAFEKPYLAASLNVVGTANVMEAALQKKGVKVIYASTWEVYGHPDYQPVDEDHPCRPDHPYNVTKLGGEQMVMCYAALKGVPAVSLRLGTAYGTGMRPNSVFSIFINKAMAGEAITVKGSGHQFRQFTHASDIADAFALALESPISGEAFNIVASEKISIRRLTELVTARMPVPVRYEEGRAGDISPAEVSSRKAASRLGWVPRVAFEDGLNELMDLAVHNRQR